jgi:actin, other eukaryote
MKKQTDKEDIKIVIDNGSGFMKAGIAGEESPKVIFPTIIGRPTKNLNNENEIFIGEEALFKKEILNLKFPIQKRNITNWDDMVNSNLLLTFKKRKKFGNTSFLS